MRWALFALVMCTAGLDQSPAGAGATIQAYPLSLADRTDLARIENHLNGVKTLRCRFLQVSSDGSHTAGDLYIARPGKLRMEYDPPVPILIVADGNHLIYYDKELKQVSYVDLESSPAGLLVNEQVALLSEELTVTDFKRSPGAFRVSLVRTEDPHEGRITLVFSDRPLALKKWEIVDAQGVTTQVSLLGTQYNLTLKSKLFEFQAPQEQFPR